MTLPIVEMFYSVQGEGPRIVPAVFIRTALCNFKCEGFGCEATAPNGMVIRGCDSIRAVSPLYKADWTHYTEFEELVADIDNILPTYSKQNVLKPDIIITGGEPIIHWDNDILQRVISHYDSRGHRVTIETNASKSVIFNRKYQDNIMFSMSVKLSNSGEPEHRRINIENITNIIEHSPQSYLKFVVSKDTWEQDWSEIRLILKSIPVFANVYLMPMGKDKQELDYNTQFIMERCVELGFNYSDRLHIRSWNDKEGV